ncbi:NupC/NupG family nucleoside CNT transporter [Enterovibrio norvegicus]|uniref:NupC/NupG family nucleoside CNT transporter n=1 Tax=Enterovibrio norvegicus TaxID=188144 RepID=UPI0038997F63
MSLIMSLVGMVVLLAIAVLLSDNRKAINIRTVGGAFAIQFILGGFILFVPWGQTLLNGMANAVQNVINYGKDGIGFLFGSLVNFSVDGIGFIFAFQVLPTVVFFSALISVLYYLGIMQFVIRILGGALRKVLGTSHAESMSATANIFVGQTEAPLVVRPYVPKMTQSELFAVMCGGMASVAGGVLAGYAAMGVPLSYLIAASFMAAPGGLLFAKIIKPETDQPIDQFGKDSDDEEEDKPANLIDAAAGGASSGMQLALNIGAMLLAFIGLIAMVNGIVGWAGIKSGFGDDGVLIAFAQLLEVASQNGLTETVNQAVMSMNNGLVTQFDPTDIARDELLAGIQGLTDPALASAVAVLQQAAEYELSLEMILGWIFAPLAFLIGVPWSEADLAGSFIGQKIVVNEFVAYLNFTPMIAELSDKTVAIISFALCGFANLSSVAILLGGLGSIAPTRRHDIARFGMKAVAAGTLSNLMSATIAGFFLTLAAL